jgi:hypothetical protein
MLTVALIFLCALSSIDSVFADATEVEAPDNVITNFLKFEIDTGSYVSGTIITLAKAPSITITLTGPQANAANTNLWYCASDTLTVPKDDAQWFQANSIFQSTGGASPKMTLPASTFISEQVTVYNKYIFFQTKYTTVDQIYYYKDARFINLIIDTAPPTNSRITAVSLDYKNNLNEYVPYDYSTLAPWVSTEIRITVTRSEDATGNVWYYLENQAEIPLSGSGTQLITYINSESLADEFFNGAYAGRILFTASDASSSERYPHSQVYNIRIDTREPAFSVDSTKVTGSTNEPSYIRDEWSAYDVRYTLVSQMADSNYGSSAQFYYTEQPLAQNNWLPLTQLDETSGYYIASSTKNDLSFKAVSEAGKEFSPMNNYWPTKIDKLTPILSLDAVDKSNATIKTSTTPSGADDYKVGYASDRIVFSATNAALNTSPVTFSYADITENPDEVSPTFKDDSQTAPYVRAFDFDSTKIQRVFIFKATSAAGLKNEFKFIVSIVPSDFTITFFEPIEYEKTNGWGKEALDVYLQVSAVIGLDYEFDFSYAPAMSLSHIPLTASFVSNADGYSIYKVTIATSIDRQLLSFTATNKSKDSKSIVTEEAIWLDITPPTALIERKLTNSNQEIDDGGWANGRVTIYLTPTSNNLSGITCYSLLEGVPTLPISLTNNSFTREVTASGKYHFLLLTGAGLQTQYTVTINIDQTQIILDNTFAYSGFSTGNVFDEKELSFNSGTAVTTHEVVETVSNNVTLKFKSTHDGHFNIYYQIYSGSNPSETGYIFVSSEELLINILSYQAISTKGQIQCAFYLESKAVNANGVRSKTAIHILKVNYDIASFSIDAIYTVMDGWATQDVIFILRSTVEIKQYQYRTHSVDGDVSDWINITGTPTLDEGNYTLSFSYGGKEQFYNGSSIGIGFSGTMYFRGISYANAISNELAGISVKIDKTGESNTNPNPLNLIPITAGIYKQSEDSYQIFTKNQTITLTIPTADVFKNFATIDYYMMTNPTKPDSTDFTEDHKISSTVVSNLTVNAYLCAKSQTGSKVIYVSPQFESVTDNTPTAIMYPSGAAKNSSGVYEYNWIDSATISITVSNIHSQTRVYFQLSMDGGITFITMNKDNPIGADYITSGIVVYQVVFKGDGDGGSSPTGYTHIGNYDSLVVFRAVTLGNLYAQFNNNEDRVRVKIDVLSPTFNIEVMQDDKVVTTAYDNNSNTETEWLSKEAFLRIIPTDPTNPISNGYEVAGDKIINPSGVIYTYTIDGSDASPLPGGGKYFSLDELISSGGVNGVFRIQVTATVRGGATKTSSTTVIIKIDRIIPVFTISAYVQPEGSSDQQHISSGEWTRAKVVNLTYDNTNPPQEPLTVTYTYYYTTNPGNVQNMPGSGLSVTEISKVVIIAENSAKLMYVQQFDVNIDFTPPVIHSGIIINNSSWVDGKEVINYDNPYKYYIDQTITYTENNLKSAYYNGFPLINGATIGTNTVDNSNGGYVHIVVEDLAGNKAELVFYMTVFELTINTITLSQEHKELLNTFKSHYDQAVQSGALTDAPRKAYFNSKIVELEDRLNTLQREVDIYKAYLENIVEKTQFNLSQDYANMYSYIILFISPDSTIRYPEWQQNEIKNGAFFTAAYAKLLSEYNALSALMEAVENLQNEVRALPAVNVVAKDDYTNILRSYNVYTNLASTQKGVFDTALFNKLTSLKAKCELLLLQDDATGVKISGDDLSPGVALEIIEYDNTTEYVVNAQKMLLSAMPVTSPRAVVYVKKLMLSDLGAQFNTGEISISLNIPEEYREYIKFGVYKLSSDGTATPINTIEIDAYGTFVTFTSKSLDTYILAVHADVTVAQEEDNVITILDIPIDYVMLTYITYVAAGLFGLALIVLVIVGFRQRAFVKKYDKNYRNSLVKRGLGAVPKGNPSPRTNPASADGSERFKYD